MEKEQVKIIKEAEKKLITDFKKESKELKNTLKAAQEQIKYRKQELKQVKKEEKNARDSIIKQSTRVYKEKLVDHILLMEEKINKTKETLKKDEDKVKTHEEMMKTLFGLNQKAQPLYSLSIKNISQGNMLIRKGNHAGGAALIRQGNEQKKQAQHLFQLMDDEKIKIQEHWFTTQSSTPPAKRRKPNNNFDGEQVEMIDITQINTTPEESSDQCSICLSEKANIMLFPCLHCVICSGCYSDFKQSQYGKKCPYCREEIKDVGV